MLFLWQNENINLKSFPNFNFSLISSLNFGLRLLNLMRCIK